MNCRRSVFAMVSRPVQFNSTLPISDDRYRKSMMTINWLWSAQHSDRAMCSYWHSRLWRRRKCSACQSYRCIHFNGCEFHPVTGSGVNTSIVLGAIVLRWSYINLRRVGTSRQLLSSSQPKSKRPKTTTTTLSTTIATAISNQTNKWIKKQAKQDGTIDEKQDGTLTYRSLTYRYCSRLTWRTKEFWRRRCCNTTCLHSFLVRLASTGALASTKCKTHHHHHHSI